MLTLGAAAPHAHQMVTEHDFATGNAGIIFDMDILIPLFGLLLLWLRHRDGRVEARERPEAWFTLSNDWRDV
jgi:hypothetical protein